MTSAQLAPSQVETVAREKAKLHKSLNVYHSTFFILAGTISLELIGQVSSYGAETLPWILIIALVFMVPSALIYAELGAAYPLEGGVYVWTKRAWGKSIAGVAATLYSIGNPIWIGGVLSFTAAAAWDTYISPLPARSLADYVFKLAFIWIAVTAAIVSLRKGKWIPTLGAIARVAALGLFSLALAVYAIRHGVHGFGLGSFTPRSFAVFFGLVPVLLFAYSGFELPSSAAEEVNNPVRDVPRAIGWATVVTTLAYSIPVFGVLTVLPSTKIDGVSGFLEAVTTTFDVFGGAAPALTKIAAITFVFGLMTAGASWMMGGDRTYAIAALDGAGPRYLGVFSSRFGTPLRVNVLTGVLATGLMVAAQLLTSGSANADFTVVLYLATSTGILCYLFVFPAALVLRFRDPHTPRPFRVPGRSNLFMAILSVLCTLWILLGVWVALFPGTLEQLTGNDYDMNAIFGLSRMRFEVFTLGTLAVLLLISVASVLVGRHETRARALVEAAR